MSDTIRVIIFKDCDQWAAQCLEYDIGAQAADLDTLQLRLSVVLDMEAAESVGREGMPFDGIEPAPERFHTMWEHRSRSFSSGSDISLRGSAPVRVDMGIAA